MKKLTCAIAILLCIHHVSAQTDSTVKAVGTDTTIVMEPVKGFDDDNITFTKVEVESTFPGGSKAWRDYLSRNIQYPARAIDKRIEGTVMLQFIVCKDGTVCDIEAISGPVELQKAAIDLLKNTPKWVPATQNGKVVRSYRKQPITFRLGRG
jgi:protein TonB